MVFFINITLNITLNIRHYQALCNNGGCKNGCRVESDHSALGKIFKQYNNNIFSEELILSLLRLLSYFILEKFLADEYEQDKVYFGTTDDESGPIQNVAQDLSHALLQCFSNAMENGDAWLKENKDSFNAKNLKSYEKTLKKIVFSEVRSKGTFKCIRKLLHPKRIR